jgi:outer membrane protein
MKVRFNVVKGLVAAGMLAAAAGASAQEANTWAVSIGANQISPKVESGPISAPALPNSLGDVSKDTQPVVVFNYFATDHFSLEAAIGTPYKDKLYGAGSIAGTGQLGTVEALPPTLFVQYRFFQPNAVIRPFVGIGLTYAAFQKETGSAKMTALTNPGAGVATTFSIDNKWTYSGQIGATWNINEKWIANAAFVKARLRTDLHFSTGQYQHVKLDPNSIMLTVGYKFNL